MNENYRMNDERYSDDDIAIAIITGSRVESFNVECILHYNIIRRFDLTGFSKTLNQLN